MVSLQIMQTEPQSKLGVTKHTFPLPRPARTPLPEGDEVLEWNGRSLQGKTFEEVYDIISESRQEPQVELIVSRQLSDVGRQPARRYTVGGLASRGGCSPAVCGSVYIDG